MAYLSWTSRTVSTEWVAMPRACPAAAAGTWPWSEKVPIRVTGSSSWTSRAKATHSSRVAPAGNTTIRASFSGSSILAICSGSHSTLQLTVWPVLRAQVRNRSGT